MSDSLQPHGLYPIRLLCPWDSLGKNSGVGCYFLLQGIFLTQGSNPCLLSLLHWQVDSLPLRYLRSPCSLQTTLISTVLDWNLLNEEPDIGLITRSLFGKWSQEVSKGSGEMRLRRGESWDRYVNELVITLGQYSSSPLENLGNFIDLNSGCTPTKVGGQGASSSHLLLILQTFQHFWPALCRGQAHSRSQRKGHSESYRLL